MIAQPLIRATGTASSAVNSCGCQWLRPAMETAALVSGNWPLTPDPAPGQWTCFPQVATRTPGADAQAVPAVRDFATATVRRWGAAERSSDVAVVVSELLTNALCHALPEPRPAPLCRAIQLGLLQPGPCILCVVADPSRNPPVLKNPSALTETGRGLHLVGAFSDGWGYAALGDRGKAVWAMFSSGPQPACAGSGAPG
jgi:Histidine kinase-like ATPase domain